jgi:DNA-binding Lrp family transcriptional regulator
LENILVDADSKNSNQPSEKDNFEKSKRSAFVFMTIESDPCSLALEGLKNIAEVKEVYVANGIYDLVAKVSGESFDHLQETIHKRIGNLNNIKSTLTLTVV